MSWDSFNEKCEKFNRGAIVFSVIVIVGALAYGVLDKDERQKFVDEYNEAHPEAAAKAEYENTKEQGSQMSESEFKGNCTNINSNTSYKNLLRDPDNYKGTKVFVDLKIENTNLGETALGMTFAGDMIVGVTCSDPSLNLWLGDRYVFYDKRKGGPKLLVGDVVRVYGYFYDSEIFQTTGGSNVDAPVLEVQYIDFYNN